MEQLIQWCIDNEISHRQCTAYHMQVFAPKTGKPLYNVWPTKEKWHNIQTGDKGIGLAIVKNKIMKDYN